MNDAKADTVSEFLVFWEPAIEGAAHKFKAPLNQEISSSAWQRKGI
jgi:uncharacterized protein Usg